jgi:exodeoxyribonuclease VII small subunit
MSNQSDAPIDAPVAADLAGLGYVEALSELQQILGELEGDTVDVDRLSALVTRARSLIEVCRSRINASRLSIETVIAELDPEA